ncbi:hypothetical protein CHS0354_027591 [Potamilus streckersoni]|uniref:Uncharacterized protein n=1 Tax=Potamilus streckersoni TaxID=2493646 RepID=A0AAE0VQ31_9BIVA|nr:hypothetical protein CHS0354_027591 [Potamilus streckersoni]
MVVDYPGLKYGIKPLQTIAISENQHGIELKYKTIWSNCVSILEVSNRTYDIKSHCYHTVQLDIPHYNT